MLVICCSEKVVCLHKRSCALLEEEDVHNPNKAETQATRLFSMFACHDSAVSQTYRDVVSTSSQQLWVSAQHRAILGVSRYS